MAGVDEAGRGPLAGPVFAAAVMLDPDRPIPGLGDSKRLSVAERERLAGVIRREALAWSVARAEVPEIDRLNILGASLLAMQRALAGLQQRPTLALIDGRHCPPSDLPMRAVVRGDALLAPISASSILAKTERDAAMVRLSRLCPGYGFEQHKGYPTLAHREALDRLGPSLHHRRRFAPVQAVLARLHRAAPTAAGTEFGRET